MRRICCIYNSGAHYRAPIFEKMDAELNCAFLFGDKPVGGSDIRSMDFSKLKNCTLVKNKIVGRAPFYWQPCVISQLGKDYDDYILLGEPFCLSTWAFIFLAKFHPHKRVFFWTHGWYGRESFAKKILKKIFFKLSSGIFLYGNYARNLMIAEGFKPEKLFVIHNSLDYQTQLKIRNSIASESIFKDRFKNENPNLIFVGRLTKIKSLDMILQALYNLKKIGKNFNLTLVGDGSERQNLEALAKQLDLEKNVWFYGACYDELMNAKLLYNADLCVSPGNVGLTAIHSLMFGCPVLTHDDLKNQMPEFEAINANKTGDFFKFNDVDSLGKKIADWFAQNKSRNEIRANCFAEIDSQWNPEFQIKVLKEGLK